tara:strand:+ start:201 stop:416 length:216 start_codon:yes stop_codon:yes gene_type:complete
MNGMLVKWIHNEEPQSICVVMREYLDNEIDFLIGPDEEVANNPLYLIYDFTANTYFYALQEELEFIQKEKI